AGEPEVGARKLAPGTAAPGGRPDGSGPTAVDAAPGGVHDGGAAADPGAPGVRGVACRLASGLAPGTGEPAGSVAGRPASKLTPETGTPSGGVRGVAIRATSAGRGEVGSSVRVGSSGADAAAGGRAAG